ncbi:MAG: hypothetical protein J6332_00425 [Abditibacteriota bacterium]|nr:hypothetical protein [Abditibacteriota bacterium]
MAVTVSAADVKRKAMITGGEQDSRVNALIAESLPAICALIDEMWLESENPNIIAALNLGALEIITGELLEELSREAGASEDFSLPGFTLGAAKVTGDKLITRGRERLKPYLARIPDESTRSLISEPQHFGLREALR